MTDSHRHGGSDPADRTRGTTVDEALQAAYLSADRRARETAVLAYATRAVLDSPTFDIAARVIVSACRALLGVTAGYVVLTGRDGGHGTVLFVDPGHEVADEFEFPPRLQALNERVSESGRPEVENEFGPCAWDADVPQGHATPDNALVTPLLVSGRVEGLMGLAGKPGGFSDDDLVLAVTFGETAALALRNSRAQEELARQKDLLDRTQSIAHIGSWGRILGGGPPMYSDETYRICGLDPARDRFRSMQDFIRIVHPDDRQALAMVAEAVLRDGTRQSVEYRVIRPDGSVRWVHSEAEAEKDAAGEEVAVSGYIQDITETKAMLDELRSARRKLDEAHRAAGIGVWEWDSASRTAVWSEELCMLTGRDPSLSSLDRAALEPYFSAESWEALRAAEDGPESAARSFDRELEMVREDGGRLWVRAVGDISRDANGLATGMHGTVQDITSRKLAEGDAERHRHRLSELAIELLSGGEVERRRIALELHEGIGQALAAAKLSALQIAAAGANGSPGEAERLAGLLDYAVDGVRLITAELSPPILYELGLGPALDWLAEGYFDRYKLRCDVSVDGELAGLKTDCGILLFRVARELLDNVHRHAGVAVARMSVAADGDSAVLRVEDEGCGFDPGSLERDIALHERYGLFSVREEVTSVGGTVTIESAPGQGTGVEVRVSSKMCDPSVRPEPGGEGRTG